MFSYHNLDRGLSFRPIRMRGLTFEIVLSFFLVSAAMDAEEKQRYMSYYNCHYANMLPGEGEAWEIF